MLTFRNQRHNEVNGNDAPRVAIVGDYDRRAYVKHVLGDRVTVVGELASDRKVHLLNEVAPDIVFLDCGSKGMNPLVSLPHLALLKGSPLVVVFAREASENEITRRALILHGADSVMTIGDTRALARLVGHVRAESRRGQRPVTSPVAA